MLSDEEHTRKLEKFMPIAIDLFENKTDEEIGEFINALSPEDAFVLGECTTEVVRSTIQKNSNIEEQIDENSETDIV